MKKNSLTSTGLSLSQAQSISNLCNQGAKEISATLNAVNNFSETINIKEKDHILVIARPLPADIIDRLKMKANLHACQAFLVENIKAKDSLLSELKRKQADISDLLYPDSPESKDPELLLAVSEDFGWEQLTVDEINEYLEAEACASHFGQFIHEGSVLDTLRKELPNVPDIKWMEVKEGVKTPIIIKAHHKSYELLKLHENLAALHRTFEQTVNYYKAKVKNLTTEENARIAKVNADKTNEAEKINNDLNSEYMNAVKFYNDKVKTRRAEFEQTRHEEIKKIANLRITVDKRFQEVVDKFLPKLDQTK